MIIGLLRTFLWITICTVVALTVAGVSLTAGQDQHSSSDDVGKALVTWKPYRGNPIFTGTGGDTWDQKIRERGYILREGDVWHLWYTGYNPSRGATMFLGYATSSDGIAWKRHADHPVFDRSWVEDVCVVKHEGVFHMFAEGKHDIAHRLTSPDGIRWTDHGSLDIRTASGAPLSEGPYGTPTIWIEDSTWYLFYERADHGIWLATSTDRQIWKNVQDEPVIARGPERYDRHAVAMNQVIRYEGHYVGVYHANDDPQWKGPWTTCLATSNDLVHWQKYGANPVIPSDDSSGILVHDGRRFRLYTMHPMVKLWLPPGSPESDLR